MIQDDELRDLFRIESEEHLQKLDDGLLHLEKAPDDQPRLDEVFREAHSMKGASRMLGVEGVEQLSHLLEDRLGQAKRGE
ncbi:MAG: Hpt domain-containing protein, partial [Leptospirales bacterium]